VTRRDATEETRAVLARRMEIVARMFAGKATYADVLELHADDFVWLSAAGVKIGHREAAEHNAERMSRIPPEALAGVRQLLANRPLYPEVVL